jgi:hypothetical protein
MSAMARAAQFRAQATEARVAEFLSAFAQYLVAAGISIPRFSALTRIAYFTAASRNARFGNHRLNQSAVAAMTGLTRVQVRKFATAKKKGLRGRSDRIDNVIAGWMTDAIFVTAGSRPRRLSRRGRGASFSRLVRKYGGDVPTQSILREMLRNKLVTVRGDHVCLNASASQTLGQSQLGHLARALALLLGTTSIPSRNQDSPHSLIGEIVYPSASLKGRIVMQKKISAGLKSFISDLHAAGTAASLEAPQTSGSNSSLTRTRVLLITEELTPDSLVSKRTE